MLNVKMYLLAGSVLISASLPAAAQPAGEDGAAPIRPYKLTEEREPCDNFDPQRRPHFGDMHVHTAWSFDASTQDTRNRTEEAYRFAKGEPMGIQPYDENDKATRTIQLDRPLDFTAVTDHSEFLGEVPMCTTPGKPGYWHPVCLIHRYFPQYSFLTFGAAGLSYKHRWGLCGDDNKICFAEAADSWRQIQKANEEAYDRSADCSFTSFNGYEWTAGAELGQNLHHNVIFRNHKVPDHALGWIETPSQVDLWDYLDEECVAGKPGCDAVVIPHNSNISGGLMFETARLTNQDIPSEPVTAADIGVVGFFLKSCSTRAPRNATADCPPGRPTNTVTLKKWVTTVLVARTPETCALLTTNGLHP
jgi:hypothetical protein